MTITNSTVSDNGGSRVGGGILNVATIEVVNSAIVFNAGDIGGGIFNEGSTAEVEVINCTIAYNVSDPGDGGGIHNEGGGTMTITNSTIANNTVREGGNGGGIFNNTEEGTIQLQNTIFALNTAPDGTGPNCSGPVTSLGNNIIGDTTGCTITLLASDLTGDPGLGAFTDNEIPGNGHFPLLPNSQAIDAGNNAVCLANPILATDQIGDPRVDICDIGSIEFEPFKNLGECISTLIKQNCSGLQGNGRAACNHEQQTFCFNLFKGK